MLDDFERRYAEAVLAAHGGKVAAAARAAGVEQSDAFRRRMAKAEEEALTQTFISQKLDQVLTDAALRARYQTEIADKPAEFRVCARHILVASEADAKAAIEELLRGRHQLRDASDDFTVRDLTAVAEARAAQAEQAVQQALAERDKARGEAAEARERAARLEGQIEALGENVAARDASAT